MKPDITARLLSLLLVSLCTLGGAVLAASISPRKLEAKPACARLLCGTADSKCFDTDVNYTCSSNGPFGGCSSSKC